MIEDWKYRRLLEEHGIDQKNQKVIIINNFTKSRNLAGSWISQPSHHSILKIKSNSENENNSESEGGKNDYQSPEESISK